jgi:hypothetical protein
MMQKNQLESIHTFLEEIGITGNLKGLQPLAQWQTQTPTAFKVFLDGRDCPGSLVVKHVSNFHDSSITKVWSPRWKVAQDYVNLEFLNEVSAGQFVPKCYGYSHDRNMIAIEDLGTISLEDIKQIDVLKNSNELWCSIARRLAELVCICPADPQVFTEAVSKRLPGIVGRNKCASPESIVNRIMNMTSHVGFTALERLEHEILRLSRMALDSNRWVGYATGDLWHAHVMIHQNLPKFIDFHCGGYDLCLADLVRLVDGTPMMQGQPLKPELIQNCKDAFLKAFTDGRLMGFNENEFEQIYSLALLRQVVDIAEYQILILKREKKIPIVIEALHMAAQSIGNVDDVDDIFADYLSTISLALQSGKCFT